MPRNIRWDESVKENALNLVEALLYQADKELDDLELKAAVHVEWVTANKLRVTGKEKQKRRNREQIVEVGTRKEHLVKLVNKTGKSLNLPQRKKESGSSPQERELAEVQTALDCLRELGVFEEEKNTRKNQGYWKFTLALKHQTAAREENLEVVRQKWKEHPKTNSLVTSSTTPILEAENSIDWHNICRTMLEKQKRLTTNELLSADEDMKFELDDIHVPLALVQRTKPDKRSKDEGNSPEQGSRLLQPSYEEKQRFRHEEFLAQVLQEGKGQSKGRRIAVIGEPGAGKTTLLQSIAFWILDKNLGLPIWISLADLQGKTLEEYLLQRWLKHALEVARVTPEQENALVELFKTNCVWLLLDGVDEIVAGSVGVRAHVGAPLQMVASQLEGWVAKARVVLSCRLNVWEANLNALGDDFEKYRLLDFDYPEQVKEFICRWFAKTDSDKGKRLWAELDKSERQRIQDLVKNPLRLSLLCSTYDPPSPPGQGGSKESLSSERGISKDSLSSPPYQGGARGGNSGLPSTKAGLYQRFLKEFYKWKENRFPTTEDQQEELNAALGRLAKRAIDQEASRFRLRHQLLREELGDPKQQGSLFWLALQLGWLNQVGLAAESETQEIVYAFFHPTFQEYFAALAIDDWDFFLPRAHDNDNPKPVSERYRLFEQQWKEVILLWLGREEVEREQKEEFIEALVEFKDKIKYQFYCYRAYFLAAAGITEFWDCRIAHQIVRKIIYISFGYFDISKQNWVKCIEPIAERAREVLQETYRQRVVQELIYILPIILDEDARQEAAFSLGQIDPGNSLAIQTLIQLTLESTRNLASWNLRQIAKGNPLAIQTLIQFIGRTENDELLSNAVQSLGQIGEDNPLAIKTLTKLVQKDQDKWLRCTAAKSLGQSNLGKTLATETLTELVQTSQDECLRCIAACDLKQIDKYNHLATQTLNELAQTAQNDSIRQLATRSLEQDNDNRQLVTQKNTGLIDESFETIIEAMMQTHENELFHGSKLMRHLYATLLVKNLQGDYLQLAVFRLKNCLTDQLYKNDRERFNDCYSVIWHCAQNMTYPAFYQAWHPQEEVGDTTTPDRQTLNQAD